MRYLLLVYDEGEWESHQSLHVSVDLRTNARLISSEELAGVSTATTVQVQNGEALVTDGPCAETKETLGGFYLIEADSLDEAIEWAARIPAARSGKVEIRPVHDNSEYRA